MGAERVLLKWGRLVLVWRQPQAANHQAGQNGASHCTNWLQLNQPTAQRLNNSTKQRTKQLTNLGQGVVQLPLEAGPCAAGRHAALACAPHIHPAVI